MTKLGDFLANKYINRANLSRQTGISTNRMFSLCTQESAQLRLEEFYLICLALELDPSEFITVICGDVKLPK